MVDLGAPAPRKSSMSSLRLATSSSNLRASRPVISSPIGPPLPLPLNSPEQAEPGSPVPSDTTGSLKKDWVNPLEVNFPRDAAAARPHTSSGPVGARSPLSRHEFDIGGKRSGSQGSIKTKANGVDALGLNGYPSPPPSVKSVEQGITRSSTEPKIQASMKVPASSSLRRVSTADRPSGLPSPAMSEERLDNPIIRNTQARRDTIMFHSPRRGSFTRQVSETGAARQTRGKSDEEKAELKRRRQTEGFEGNFSAFNFGGNSTQAPPLPTERAISPTSMGGSPTEALPVSLPAVEKKTAQERGMDAPLTVEVDSGTDNETRDSDADSMTLPAEQDPGSGETTPSSIGQVHELGPKAQSVESLAKPMRPRVDSDTRCPGTPTALRAPPPLSTGRPPSASQTSLADAPDLEPAQPPRLNPDGRSQSPLLSRTPIEGDFPVFKGLPRGRRPDSVSSQRSSSLQDLSAPPPRLNPDRRAPSPLRSMPPMEGDFPTHKGLPRGRRPDSLSSRRGRSPAPLDFEAGPPPRLNPDRRAPSPLSARQPMEGDFPVTKGLPRGRRPGPTSSPVTPGRFSGVAPPRPAREIHGITAEPGWATRAEKHMSAVPAPLSPLSGHTGYGSDLDSSPSGLAPPRIPSPTFTSLEESVSGDLSKALGLDAFDSPPPPDSHNKPLISPVLSEFGGRHDRGSPMRTEASKAPPRPPPISLPPSSPRGTPDSSIKSPVSSEFAPSFI